MKPWLLSALTTLVFWGVWGAFTGTPEKNGFPETLGYVVWSVTMILPAIVMLALEKFHIDRHRKAIIYGTLIGVTGCGGTVLLFKVLTIGPAYLVFPIIALSPTITVLLSFALLRERTGKLGALGIVLAIISVLFFSVQDPQKGEFGHGWLLMSLVITVAWGVQAYYMKVASQHMSSASICFYNTLAALAFIPLTLWMTNFHQTINWGWSGVGAATVIQLLNAIGFCTFVFAFRHGKGIIVAPLCNGYPVITVLVSLAWYRTLPTSIQSVAIILGIGGALLMVLDEARQPMKSY